jgi:hypothetical protein
MALRRWLRVLVPKLFLNREWVMEELYKDIVEEDKKFSG